MSSSSEISFPPYEVVPATRPIIVIGPSLRGYEVKFKPEMTKAITIANIKKFLEQRVIQFWALSRISTVLRVLEPSTKNWGSIPPGT